MGEWGQCRELLIVQVLLAEKGVGRGLRGAAQHHNFLVTVTWSTPLQIFLFLFPLYLFYNGYFLLFSVSFASDFYLTTERLFFSLSVFQTYQQFMEFALLKFFF